MDSCSKRRYSVLIADDSEDDRFFLRRALSRFPRFAVIGEVCDGQEAVDYLAGENQFTDRQKYPIPDLLLLDLNMPRKSGFDVLQWLRKHSFPALTVIILSGSSLAQDIGAALSFGAHGYRIKTSLPARQDAITQEIEALLDKRASLQG